MKYISAVAALLLTGASAAVSSMQGGRHAIFNGVSNPVINGNASVLPRRRRLGGLLTVDLPLPRHAR